VHARNILHRDIKPENIMLDDSLNIVLSDFGLAVRMPESGKHQGRAGTPCYYPYEMVASQSYDFRADLWCVGVLLVEMLFGQLPFKSASANRDYTQSILSLKFNLPKNKTVSNDARNLIESLLVVQDKRLTLAQVEKHPWL